MTIVALDDPFRIAAAVGGLVPVAALAYGGLATGYCLAGFQPETPAAVSVTDPLFRSLTVAARIRRLGFGGSDQAHSCRRRSRRFLVHFDDDDADIVRLLGQPGETTHVPQNLLGHLISV